MALNLRNDLIRASKIHFEAHIEKHRINVENLLNNSEHADIMDTIEKELEEISKYHDLLEVLSKYFPREFDGDDTKKLLHDSAI